MILASGSPQRRRLLEEAGYAFEVVAPQPHAECGVCSRETPPEQVARLARQKAADVAEQLRVAPCRADYIVACDTLAECMGHVLGKPSGREHARDMLERLRGRDHHLYSGLCLWPLRSASPRVQVARTTLRMDLLSDEQISEYLDSGLWQDKAGAFGYQDRAGWLHILAGSESNVIGLPMELLDQMLAEARHGVSAPEKPPDLLE